MRASNIVKGLETLVAQAEQNRAAIRSVCDAVFGATPEVRPSEIAPPPPHGLLDTIEHNLALIRANLDDIQDQIAALQHAFVETDSRTTAAMVKPGFPTTLSKARPDAQAF